MNPTVTIGMCVYNSERTLDLAINSIIRQDFPHDQMELIFVDDGSQDNSLGIINDFVLKIDIKTRIFKTKWRGVGPARNIIVRSALGNYIIWVDADEVLTDSYIRKQVDFIEQNQRIGLTAGVFKTVPGNLILNLELIPWIVSHKRFKEPRTFLWKTTKIPGTGGSTFRVEALRQVGGFDEELSGAGEDQDVALRIKDAGWSISLNDAQFYELHGGMSTFKQLWKKYLWYGYGCRKIYLKDKNFFSIARMSPVAGFVTGFFYSLTAYKLLRNKQVFLLPLHYGFKMTAWTLGFIKSQINQ